MIVRILGEGQYEVPDSELGHLESLDAKLSSAIDANDGEAYTQVLDELLQKIRTSGSPVDAGTIVSSELTIPHEGVTLDEMKRLLASGDAVEV